MFGNRWMAQGREISPLDTYEGHSSLSSVAPIPLPSYLSYNTFIDVAFMARDKMNCARFASVNES